ncbi:hypothetical protein F4778DRAFT_717256 [Xylariomycetidae sp. FL2044]|nr:hypothetical protein F4778DRAFT_717256 [Xylariomycetidae sp. FL2044]
MGIVRALTTALALASASCAAPASPSVQFCDPVTTVCYSSSTVGVGAISYRVAIPVVDVAPFDMLVQIVAPKTAGWAGIAWGGRMINNTITIGWANGNSSTVSSRWASAHVLPDIYEGAEYTLLEGSGTNDTHWTVNALCKGCSVWTHDGGATTSLDPSSTEANFAWATAPTPPYDPADNTTIFGLHTEHGTFTIDLAAAKTDQFDAYLQALMP